MQKRTALVGGKSAETLPLIQPITLRLDQVARSLGIARRTLERERSAGRFPKEDLTIGRMPLWRPATIERWVDSGGRTA
jgi:predicted DNA-binding transcriptional regulator AlpA